MVYTGRMFEWITGLIEQSGYLGIAFAMFLENIFPPIPSELVMIFSGGAASGGGLNIFLVILVAAIGSTLGLVPWFYAGKLYGQERLITFADRHGRFLTFSGDDVKSAEKWFYTHGKKITMASRALPGVRTFIAIPASIMKMDIKIFLAYAFLGSLVWDGIFGFIGYYVGGNAGALMVYVDIGTYVALIGVAAWYIYRVISFKENTKEKVE